MSHADYSNHSWQKFLKSGPFEQNRKSNVLKYYSTSDSNAFETEQLNKIGSTTSI